MKKLKNFLLTTANISFVIGLIWAPIAALWGFAGAGQATVTVLFITIVNLVYEAISGNSAGLGAYWVGGSPTREEDMQGFKASLQIILPLYLWFIISAVLAGYYPFSGFWGWGPI